MQRWRAFLPVGILMVGFFIMYSFLPSVGSSIYASPDETAVAVATREIALHGRVFLSDPNTFDVPWLHPRSWVSVGRTIAPVGFLGWSVFLVPWYWLFGSASLPWIGSLVLVSGIWPFFHLVAAYLGSDRRRAYQAACVSTLIAWSFPSFILYGNRSLFPNGPALVFFLWACWMLYLMPRSTTARMRLVRWLVAVFCIGLVCTVRPIEAVWMIPWWVWFGWGIRPSRREMVLGGTVFALTVLPATVLAAHAYGAWFTAGYWLHDRVIPSVLAPASTGGLSASRSVWQAWLPYGFHPRHILWNVTSFLFMRLWVWTWLTLGVFLVGIWKYVFKNQMGRMASIPRSALMFAGLSVWTIFCLLVIYGSGLYTDHVRVGAVTIGNSFLRYLLPSACLIGMIFGVLFMQVGSRWKQVALGLLSLIFVATGIQQAFFADDEGLWFTRMELKRYAAIRALAVQSFDANAVIFSERSDKVFFPLLRAVSPLPPPTEMARLAHLSVQIGLFARPLSQAQKDQWRQAGFDVQDLGSFGRERLYKLLTPSL